MFGTTHLVARSRWPWLTNTDFKGCTNPGSGTRRIKAWVLGINDKPEQDWRLLCETTPFTWNHITYNNPTHCEAPVSIVSSHVLCHDIDILTELWLSVGWLWEKIRDVGYSRPKLLTSLEELVEADASDR